MMSYNGIDLPIVTPEFSAWIAANIPPGHVFEFDTYYDSNATACLPVPPAFEPPPIRAGVLHWPTGASRWATFHTVMTGPQLAELRLSLGATTAYPEAALVIDDGVDSVTAMMAMLPPRPLSGYSPYASDAYDSASPYNSTDEAYGENNDLWLVTLVDDRYFWWFIQDTETIGTTSWETVFTAILGGLGLSTGGAAVLGLGYPKPGKRWAVRSLPLPLLLDAAATAVGCRVTRDMLSGVVSIQSWRSARSQSRTLYARQFDSGTLELGDSDFARVAGGAYVGQDLRRTVPASVTITPNDDGSDPSTVTLASLAAVLPYFNGLTGRPGESVMIRTDNGETLTDAMKAQIASDWYGWQLADVDLTLAGISPWDACAWQEAVSWEHRGGKAVTRITRPSFPLGAARGLCRSPGGFWVALVEKTMAGSCPKYSFRRATDNGNLTWTLDGTIEENAWEVNCVDLPVVDPNDPYQTGSPPTIAFMQVGKDGRYLFHSSPRVEFVKASGTPDANGYYAGTQYYFPPGSTTPTPQETVLVIDLNAV